MRDRCAKSYRTSKEATLRLFPLIFLLIGFTSCTSEKDKLYDKMAKDFCNCFSRDSTQQFGEQYSDCVDTVLTLNKKELSELGIEKTDFTKYSKLVEDFLSKPRMEKFCPTFYPKAMAEFEAIKKMRSIELKFFGRFHSKQKIGKHIYLVGLQDSKDSVHQFLCNDSINLNEIKIGQNVSVIYSEMNRNQYFIKSMAKK